MKIATAGAGLGGALLTVGILACVLGDRPLSVERAIAQPVTPAQPVRPAQAVSPAVERALVETTKKINQAFVRGDLQTLSSFVSDDFTMLHGHMKRIDNKNEAVAEWSGLFAKRSAAGMAY